MCSCLYNFLFKYFSNAYRYNATIQSVSIKPEDNHNIIIDVVQHECKHNRLSHYSGDTG